MRMSISLDDDLIKKASALTGIKDKTIIVNLGLKILVARESSKRLAKLGGTQKGLRLIPRRRSIKE